MGSIYIGMMVALAIVGILLMEVGGTWSVLQRREREEQLLFAGDQIRRGLQKYAASGPAAGMYPKTLDMLLRDERHPAVLRHLRSLYVDPMSGKPDWGIVPGLGGSIMGVYSKSVATPMRQANFPRDYLAFAGKASYREWIFRADGQAVGPIVEQPVPITWEAVREDADKAPGGQEK